MKRDLHKHWFRQNWLSLAVGLVLPGILSALWSLFRGPLEALSIRMLSSLLLAFVLLCCVTAGVLIYFTMRLFRTERYVQEKFYPNKTTVGMFHTLKEEMEHDREISKGWNEAVGE